MRSLALLVFLYLVVPGSGRLVFDGLPLSTRAEFAALVLFVAVFFSQEMRRVLAEVFRRSRWSAFVKPLLLVLCVLKFLSFAWSPLGDGFGACYRSLYHPLSDTQACEKSYEAPFIPRTNPMFANILRVDPSVNFGASPYDWSLPFMNDFPRLGNLWLKRFPFSATYTATVSNGTTEAKYIPIRALGEVEARINSQLVASAIDYDRDFLLVAPIQPGTSKLQVAFRYSDVDSEDPPETEPVPRGPYAQLRVGAVMSAQELTAVSKVLIRGNFTASTSKPVLGAVSIRDSRGADVGQSVTRNWETDPPLRKFDFELVLPASALRNSPLTIVVNRGGKSIEVAKLTQVPGLPFEVKLEQPGDSDVRITAAFTIASRRIESLSPPSLSDYNSLIAALLAILDVASLIVVLGLLLTVLKTMGRALPQALGLAVFAWLLVEPIDDLLPAVLGGGRELVVQYAILAILFVCVRKSALRFPLAYLLPVTSVLATQKVLEHLYFDHPDHPTPWWGKLLYYWRDSDWLVARGKARSIFLESSLYGGDSVFYSQPASRYLSYLGSMLLGENDILIGFIAVAIGILVLTSVVLRFAERADSGAGLGLAAFSGFIGLILLGDQLMVAFGFLLSSEFPTWVIILGVTMYLLRETKETRVWALTGLATMIALLAQFRPNNVFLSLALVPLTIVKVEKSSFRDTSRLITSAISAFVIVMPLSLIHNLFYGSSFVPLTTNASINYAFSWGELFGQSGVLHSVDLLWSQLRALMYWRAPHDPNFAIFFWGAQLIFVLSLVRRARHRLLRTASTLIALLPLSYIVPMLKFLYSSYYPRHLVTASLLCLCSGLLLWPTSSKEMSKAA